MELKAFPPPRWIIVLLLVNTSCSKGSIAPSPRVTSVCPGEQLTLMCIANHSSILSWTILLPQENISRNVPFIGLDTQQSLTLNGTTAVTLNFTRISESGTLPLIAKLQINRVNTDILNETQIHCFPSNESDPRITFIIRVIDLEANSYLRPLEVETHVLNLEATSFTVILNWTQETNAHDTVSYNVSIDPLTELVPNINNSWQVMGSYNTLYNVSIVAILCENTALPPSYLLLEFAKCSHPLAPDQANFIKVINIRDPMIEGTTVTFSCSSGQILIGPNVSVCMDNGEWKPDTKQVQCMKVCDPPPSPPHGYVTIPFFDQQRPNLSITFVCQNTTPTDEVHILSFCDSFGKWKPNPKEFCSRRQVQTSSINVFTAIGSSVSVLLLSSVVFLVIGCICCCCKQKQKQTLCDHSSTDHEQASHTQDNTTTPIYEDLLQETMNFQDTNIEFKPNVAYVTVQMKK